MMQTSPRHPRIRLAARRPADCANITGSYATVSPAMTGADHYLQLSFGSTSPSTTTAP
jgi:hypothetical protein